MLLPLHLVGLLRIESQRCLYIISIACKAVYDCHSALAFELEAPARVFDTLELQQH